MQTGDILPNFRLKGVDGQEYTNFEYADRYALLILFTCNTCKVSQAYRERVADLVKQYEEDNLGIMCINSCDCCDHKGESYEEMVRLSHNANMPYLYLYDGDQKVAQLFGATHTPEAFVFNSKRELIYHGAIDDAWENAEMVTSAYLEDAIEAALDNIEVDYPETPVTGTPINWK